MNTKQIISIAANLCGLRQCSDAPDTFIVIGDTREFNPLQLADHETLVLSAARQMGVEQWFEICDQLDDILSTRNGYDEDETTWENWSLIGQIGDITRAITSQKNRSAQRDKKCPPAQHQYYTKTEIDRALSDYQLGPEWAKHLIAIIVQLRQERNELQNRLNKVVDEYGQQLEKLAAKIEEKYHEPE